MILILEHLNNQDTIAPLLLAPEPRLQKCSSDVCLRRLGAYVPGRKKALPKVIRQPPANPPVTPSAP